MRTGTKIVLSILGIAAILMIALAVWQWNNLKALYDGLAMDPAAIQEELDANQEAFEEAMDAYHVPKKEFTQEEIDQLVNGEVSADDVADSLIQKEEPSSGEGQTPPEETVEDLIQKEIAKMYVLRETYVGKLDAIVQSAIDEYAASGGSQSKEDIVYGKMGELTALEKECDQQVAAVTSRLRELLKEAGQDNSLAELVEDTYQSEKSMKKASYIQQLRGG